MTSSAAQLATSSSQPRAISSRPDAQSASVSCRRGRAADERRAGRGCLRRAAGAESRRPTGRARPARHRRRSGPPTAGRSGPGGAVPALAGGDDRDRAAVGQPQRGRARWPTRCAGSRPARGARRARAPRTTAPSRSATAARAERPALDASAGRSATATVRRARGSPASMRAVRRGVVARRRRRPSGRGAPSRRTRPPPTPRLVKRSTSTTTTTSTTRRQRCAGRSGPSRTGRRSRAASQNSWRGSAGGQFGDHRAHSRP